MIRPTGTSTSFAHIDWRNATAPGPDDLDLRERRLVEQAGRPSASRAPRRRSRATSARPPSRAVGAPRRRRRRSSRTSSGAPSRTSRRRTRRDPRGSGRSAPSAAAGRTDAPRSGSGCRSRSRSSRSSARACSPGFDRPARTAGCPSSRGRARARRRRSTTPSGARSRPRPAIPCAENPAATKKPRDLGLAEDELVVRREALGAVDDPVDARVGHRRDAPDGALHDRLEALHVGRQQLAVEVGRDAVERPRRRVALVAAHAQPADLLAEVDEVVRVAELRQARVDALDRLGEEVLVRHRDDRHGDADHPADLRREHAAGVDHDVGADLGAFARVLDGHAGHAAAIRADRDDPGVRADLGAALPRAGGQRVGQPGRVEPAVGRQPDGAEDAVGRHQREAILRLARP